jgi:hypothetical protein
MDEQEARAILKIKTAVCTRCHGTGIYLHYGECYRCFGAARLPATRRQIIEAERVLGLRPPAKPRSTRTPETPVFDSCEFVAPF